MLMFTEPGAARDAISSALEYLIYDGYERDDLEAFLEDTVEMLYDEKAADEADAQEAS